MTKKDKDRLWGGEGPYSEAHLVFESRIVDDHTSRKFLMVHLHINPYTFEMVRRNRMMFIQDRMIMRVLDEAEYMEETDGYLYVAYEELFENEKQLEDANYQLGLCERAAITMHRFVLTFLKKRLVH